MAYTIGIHDAKGSLVIDKNLDFDEEFYVYHDKLNQEYFKNVFELIKLVAENYPDWLISFKSFYSSYS